MLRCWKKYLVETRRILYFTAVFEVGDGVRGVRNIAVYRFSVYNTIRDLLTIIKGGIQLSSSKSLQVSLAEVKRGRAGLNKHRQSLLDRIPAASSADRNTLSLIGQKKSRIISAITGREIEFTDREFDDGVISERSGDDVDIRRGEENR